MPAVVVENTVCPGCHSNLRHRLFWEVCRERLTGTVLHFAPEPCLSVRLAAMPEVDYITADLLRTDVKLITSISAINLPDGAVDGVIAIHVLEHVRDDRAAMNEVFRVLKGGGWFALAVPLWDKATLEDPSIVTDEARAAAYGQANHVRIYGRDIEDRLSGTGFEVEVFDYRTVFNGEVERNFQHDAEGVLFLAAKPGDGRGLVHRVRTDQRAACA
ncbi:MAG: methyltransferase domain-containing protein [Deltaproteobacteria bacterium]|nr:methyltransferase domain-containing protein [Deltaproteobacteria bacterium]